jgi:hypothetical protein
VTSLRDIASSQKSGSTMIKREKAFWTSNLRVKVRTNHLNHSVLKDDFIEKQIKEELTDLSHARLVFTV